MKKMEGFKELKRDRLENILSDYSSLPLTIVTGPMGYGKSTLVRSFLDRLPEGKQALWLDFRQDEKDEVWIWRRLCGKLKAVDQDLAEKLIELGLPKDKGEIETLFKLISQKKVPELYLVLEDYHECRSAAIDRFLTRIIFEDIPYFHIILVSRVFPDIPYEEMLLKGYSGVVDQQSLTLTQEEIDQFYRDNGVVLAPAELQNVEQYTDGWISAVYLSLLDYKKTGRLRQTVSILHLLKTSIYDRFLEPARELLMKMSLFESFSLECGRYVAEVDVSAVLINGIVDNMGFLKYDDAAGCYLMHSLLRAVTLRELERAGLDKKQLYHRYAGWNEQNGNYVQAIQNYELAQDTDRIFRILEEKDRYEILENAPAILEGFFDRTDTEVCLNHPKAYLSYIYFMIIYKNSEKGARLFQEAQQKYGERSGGIPDYDQLEGELNILQAFLGFNDLVKINTCMEKAYRLRQGRASEVFRSMIMTYGVPETLTLYHSVPGSLEKTVELEKQYAKYYMALIVNIDGGWEELYNAEYCCTLGDMEKAVKYAGQAAQKAVFRRQMCVMISSYFVLLRAAVFMGDAAEFQKRMEELAQAMEGATRSALVKDHDLMRGYLYGCIGELDKVPEWIKNFELEECNHIVRSMRSGCSSYGMVLQKAENWVLLEAVAEQMMVPYRNIKHIYAILQGLIYKAIAARHLYGTESGVEMLSKALELASPDHIKMPFIENSRELLPLLEVMSKESPDAKELLPFCRQYLKGLKAFCTDERKPQEIKLTPREQELIQLLRQGYRNMEISRKLNIALVTVEKNLTSVYRKLDVTNRTAALAKIALLQEDK